MHEGSEEKQSFKNLPPQFTTILQFNQFINNTYNHNQAKKVSKRLDLLIPGFIIQFLILVQKPVSHVHW